MIKINEGIFPLLLKLAMPTTGTYLCARRSFHFPGIRYGFNSFSDCTDVRIKIQGRSKGTVLGAGGGGWGEGEGMWGGVGGGGLLTAVYGCLKTGPF